MEIEKEKEHSCLKTTHRKERRGKGDQRRHRGPCKGKEERGVPACLLTKVIPLSLTLLSWLGTCTINSSWLSRSWLQVFSSSIFTNYMN